MLLFAHNTFRPVHDTGLLGFIAETPPHHSIPSYTVHVYNVYVNRQQVVIIAADQNNTILYFIRNEMRWKKKHEYREKKS